MEDFQNQRRFSLRCLSADIIPVSIKLKSNIKSPKGYNIRKRAENALLNERIRMVNSTITMFGIQIDTCMNQLKGILNKKPWKSAWYSSRQRESLDTSGLR